MERVNSAAPMQEKAAKPKQFCFPLSLAQKRLWILSQFEGTREAYNIPAAYTLKGSIEPDILQRALDYLVTRHEALRTCFDYVNGEPHQIVNESGKIVLELTSFESKSHDDAMKLMRDHYEIFSRQQFDLKNGPLLKLQLLKLEKSHWILFFSIHHIISDAWSIGIFLRELSLSYGAIKNRLSPDLPELPIQYADFALWQRDLLASAEFSSHLSFWKDYLLGSKGYLPLPIDYQRPILRTFRGKTIEFTIDPFINRALKLLAQSTKASMYLVTLAAFSLMLARYSNESDFVIGSPSVGRDRSELESVIGFFVNTLVIRIKPEMGRSFLELLSAVRESLIKSQAHQVYPLESLVEKLNIDVSPSHNPLFQVLFSYENNNYDFLQIDNFEISRLSLPVETSKFDITLTLSEKGETLVGAIEYSTDLFAPVFIEKFAENYKELLSYIAKDPHKKLTEYPIVADHQLREIVCDRNDTLALFDVNCSVDCLVTRQAAVTPDNTAIAYSKQTISYARLEALSNQLCNYLRAMGISPGTIIGVYIEPCIDMVISLLAIFKAGCSYLPLDPDLPQHRLSYITNNTELGFIIGRSLSGFSTANCIQIDLERQHKDIQMHTEYLDAHASQINDLAYLIYTSGSTGLPKGVEISHRSVVNFLLSMKKQLNYSASDRMLAVTSLSFDISVLEIFLPLISGATLVIAPNSTRHNGQLLEKLLNSSSANIMQATPSTWRLLREAKWQPTLPFSALCGGEALPEELADWLNATVEKLYNMYGPTETTVWSTMQLITSNTRPVSIGRPIANTRVYVLDESHSPVPDGVTGELYIAGEGVGLGYRNDKSLSDQRFFNLFIADRQERVYRTGDLVRYRYDGSLQYIARADNQIKMNGYRIELGEIESNLIDHPEIEQAIVVNRSHDEGSSLLAYCTTLSNKHPLSDDIKRFLRQRVPSYMVPKQITIIDKLPLTANGKIDRKSLQDSRPVRQIESTGFKPPRTSAEKKLAEVWRSILKVEKVGLNDNFFDLGGASLQCVMASNAAAEKGLLLKPEDIFEFETLKAIANACEQNRINTGLLGGLDFETSKKRDIEIDLEQILNGQSGHSKRAKHANMIFDSLGVYLPETSISSKEIVDGCTNPLAFPLEKITGIRSRRVAANGEYAIDLAIGAIEDALSRSKYLAAQIELVICCNISRYDGDKRFYFEPTTSMRLVKYFNFCNAQLLDISNACTGMFTAIHLAQAYLLTANVNNALIVSGEYITHLTNTVQKEIVDYLDARIACLTLGDAGAAVIIERSEFPSVGFQDFEMFTLGAYSDLCIAKKTDKPHGGVVMLTDAIRMVENGYRPSALHTLDTVKRNSWSIQNIDHFIMHQTSEITLKQTEKEINQIFKNELIKNNLVKNVKDRGNTATTTHFVALMDQIKSGKIRSGDNIVFIVSGSGMNFGTAIYTLDDLPEKVCGNEKLKVKARCCDKVKQIGRTKPTGMVIDGIGLAIDNLFAPSAEQNSEVTTIDLLRRAATSCLKNSNVQPASIELLLFAGVYRTDFVVEPAIASLLAGELGLNAEDYHESKPKTFAYDILNGSMGFLSACHVATQYLSSGLADTIMISAAEVDNNRHCTDRDSLGLLETGSAMIVKKSDDKAKGFGGICFYSYPERISAFTSYWTWCATQHYIEFKKSTDISTQYIDCIRKSIDKFMVQESFELSDIDWIVPPVLSEELLKGIEELLEVHSARIVRLDRNDYNLYTSSMPYVISQLIKNNQVHDGDVCLIISVGSGIQVGLALYYF